MKYSIITDEYYKHERVNTVYRNKGDVYMGKLPRYWQKLTQIEIETSHIRRLNKK